MKTSYVTLNIRMFANKTDPAMEAVILNLQWDWLASRKAYEYARKIKKKRWKKGEEVIKRHPYYAYLYARHVVKGRWPEAEENISRGSNASYLYARYVLKERFELAENRKENFTNPKDIYLYSKYMLKSRWKKKESKILGAGFDVSSIVNYAKFVIKGRWKKAESIIAKSYHIGDYVSVLNGSDLEEFENMLLLESLIEPQNKWQRNCAKYYIENKKTKPVETAVAQ